MNRKDAELIAIELVKQVEFHIGNQRLHNSITLDGPLLVAQLFAVLLETKVSLVN